jgi:DNA-binding HxlR family transcriptional regulator
LPAREEGRTDPAPRSGCPINAAVEVLGGPWAILVLRDVTFGNRRHSRELVASSEEDVATTIFASRLRQLVEAGRLSRNAADRGQRAASSLIEVGVQKLPVMVALGNWGLAHREGEHQLRSALNCSMGVAPGWWGDDGELQQRAHRCASLTLSRAWRPSTQAPHPAVRRGGL